MEESRNWCDSPTVGGEECSRDRPLRLVITIHVLLMLIDSLLSRYCTQSECRQCTLANLIADLPTLINHGLSALHDTLQQDKHLTQLNTSIAIIGPSSEAEGEANLKSSGAAKRGHFRTWENDEVEGLLRAWRRSRGEPEEGPKDKEEQDQSNVAQDEAVAAGVSAEGSENAPPGTGAPGAAGSGEDVTME